MKRLLLLMALFVLLSASPADATVCAYGACYSHFGVASRAAAEGASATMTVGTPSHGGDGMIHALAELAVSSRDDDRSVIEVGWITRGGSPELFVFHWKNGQPTCYNGCGFVPRYGATARAGMTLTPGTEIRVRISHIENRWAVFFNGEEFGSYPDSLWSSPWPSLLRAMAFGEVAAVSPSVAVEMNGGVRLRTFGRRAWCQPAASDDPRYVAVTLGMCAMTYSGPT